MPTIRIPEDLDLKEDLDLPDTAPPVLVRFVEHFLFGAILRDKFWGASHGTKNAVEMLIALQEIRSDFLKDPAKRKSYREAGEEVELTDNNWQLLCDAIRVGPEGGYKVEVAVHMTGFINAVLKPVKT